MKVDQRINNNKIVSDLSINEIFSKLPSEVFQKSTTKALKPLLLSISFAIFGYYLASLSWVLLPFVWVFLGAVYVGLCSVAHDCSKESFSNNKLVNSIVGTIVSLPLLVPFESWKLHYETQQFEEMFHRLALGRTWWIASTLEWLRSNFALSSVWVKGQRTRIMVSIISLWIFGFVFFSTMRNFIGFWGLVKFWFVPWVLYHFWKSSFIQSVYKVPFTDMTLKFAITFPSKTPKWLELITNDIHTVLTFTRSMKEACVEVRKQGIPNHNIKKAYKHISTYIADKSVDLQESARQKLSWISATFIVFAPFIVMHGLITTEMQYKTLILMVVLYFLGGLGITLGYHRMWSHRTFKTNSVIRFILMLCGSSAFEGSALWWGYNHRNHHRYIGTDKDPYNIKKGFWWAHVGWLLYHETSTDENEFPEFEDLKKDPLLKIQDKYYNSIAIITGIITPTLIAGLGWGDYWGGFYYAALLRTVLVIHCTCFFNSIVYYFGKNNYSDSFMTRDSWWVSLLTFGEGYNNFHHEFPNDYRNGLGAFDFDPAKWIIFTLEFLGLAHDVKRTPKDEIKKAELAMKEKKLDELKKTLNWGKPLNELPLMTMETYQQVSKERKWLLVDGLIFDLSKFHFTHPGGMKILNAYYGYDATEAFNGAAYNHSNAARNLSRTLMVAKLDTTEEQKHQQHIKQE